VTHILDAQFPHAFIETSASLAGGLADLMIPMTAVFVAIFSRECNQR
jgi:hypothetical protein